MSWTRKDPPVSDQPRATRDKATYVGVLNRGEFRSIYTASALSWGGDYLAQAALLIGYGPGAALAAFAPRGALLLDAATFGLSALVIRLGVARWAPALVREARSRLLRETAEGLRLVLRTDVLRAIAILVFLLV